MVNSTLFSPRTHSSVQAQLCLRGFHAGSLLPIPGRYPSASALAAALGLPSCPACHLTLAPMHAGVGELARVRVRAFQQGASQLEQQLSQAGSSGTAADFKAAAQVSLARVAWRGGTCDCGPSALAAWHKQAPYQQGSVLRTGACWPLPRSDAAKAGEYR